MLEVNRDARVAVVGTSCSGKTTFARRLSRALDVPHVELDALYWGPGWSPAPPEDFRASVRDAISAPAWVADGNYSAVRDLVWSRATAVVWLDLPLRVVFPRALGRTLRRAITREELFGGNRESLRGITARDWIPGGCSGPFGIVGDGTRNSWADRSSRTSRCSGSPGPRRPTPSSRWGDGHG